MVEKEVIDGDSPFFREKPRSVALSEGERLVITCVVASDPKASNRDYEISVIRAPRAHLALVLTLNLFSTS